MVVKPPDGTQVLDPAAVAEAHRRLLEDRSIQFELQRLDLTPPEPPAWLKWLAEELFEGMDFEAPDWLRSIFNFFEGVAPGLGTAFYVLLGILVLVAILLLARFVAAPPVASRRRAGCRDRPSAGGGRGPRFARRGGRARRARALFSEAAHLLLFRSIEDIDSRRPELVQPGLHQPRHRRARADPAATALGLRPDRDERRAQPVRAAAARRGRLARLPRGL